MKPSKRFQVTVPVLALAAALAWAPAAWADDEEQEADEEIDDEEADEEADGEEADEQEADEEDGEEAPAEESKASLLIPVSEEGAIVLIDGEEVGTTPLPPIKGLTVGSHVVEVEKEGFHTYHGEVKIPDAGLVRYDIDLKGGKRKRKPVPKFLKAWWFWTAIGVAAATGAGIGIYFGVRPEQPDGVKFPPY
jgi:hypothetical protein